MNKCTCIYLHIDCLECIAAVCDEYLSLGTRLNDDSAQSHWTLSEVGSRSGATAFIKTNMDIANNNGAVDGKCN